MANFFSPEAEMVLMGQDDGLGHLFPSSSCQSPPSIMYSPPLHQMAPQPTTTQPPHAPIYSQPHDYRQMVTSPYPPSSFWPSQPSQMAPTHVSYSTYPPISSVCSTQTLAPDSALLPQRLGSTRPVRSLSASSSGTLGMPLRQASERSPPSLSRSLSPSSPDLRAYGYPNKNGTWSCAYPGCTSRAVFTRGCDLRKHHKRHTKSFFCRHEGCPQSTGGGFSSKKDLARHEAKHNPGVLCEWDGCDRVFSRVDNMRDHVKRIHLKAARSGAGAMAKQVTV
ncbi:hypothetical protein BU24DRAFT_168531 [Aaosphaeria arxii CBS 175.79]|uniref:C2H2-type domain-containing protein n=1 Tax=Aaosphaeria arxii CBS 175.79 TaxID=1450172 RepID=A0A6A5XZJ1_9PLEO|nr:uncharacterized protein BU24DRAFT_168531 [Aaosphaeria arxii CBS 175.79]KAF2018323.1 hypothetical protein BU24DRAFT_168531 [Aaosphaeria arxii CBS 175.79]